MKRRQLLALSAAAATTGIAGCSGAIPGTGSGGGGGTVEFDTERVLNLMHAPGTFEDREHYRFSASAPAAVDGLREDLDEEVFSQLVSAARFGRGGSDLIRAAGVDFWDVGTRYSAGPVTAITGDFSREDIFRRLRYEGLQYQGDYGGYALIESDSDSASGVTLAVEGEGPSDAEEAPADISLVLLAAEVGDTSSNAVMRDVIDTAEGEGERYRDAVEPVGSLMEGLGGSALLSGETFEVVSPDEGPSASLDHDPITPGQSVSGTLTADSTATVNGQEFQFIDRYGFAGAADTEVTITVESSGTDGLALILYSGNDDSAPLGNRQGSGEFEFNARLPEDGAYNFIVYDPEQINLDSGTDREYTVEVSLSGGGLGGPENGVFEGEVARGSAVRFDEENMIHRRVLVFEDQPSMDGIETWVSENEGEGELFGRYESVSQDSDGDRAIVEGTIPLDNVEPDDVRLQ